MELALALGLTLFLVCWLVHLVIWRLFKPQAYPIWLSVILFFFPLVSVAVFCIGGHIHLQTENTLLDFMAAGILHVVLSCSYICGFAGIVEYSPSAEILLVVKEHMPIGIPEESLKVDSLTEYALTGKRINHLLGVGLVSRNKGRYSLTGAGQIIVHLFRFYRKFLGVDEMGEG
jgi:hypothetical protein